METKYSLEQNYFNKPKTGILQIFGSRRVPPDFVSLFYGGSFNNYSVLTCCAPCLDKKAESHTWEDTKVRTISLFNLYLIGLY